MSILDQIRLSYPLPIARLYEIMQLETEPQLRVQKIVFLFEGTIRYLALIGLASYVHYSLIDTNVEMARAKLKQPSFGHWLNLLRSTAAALVNADFYLLVHDFSHKYERDSILEASQVLSRILGHSHGFQKVELDKFLGKVIDFRNRKIGHDVPLSVREAIDVLTPLEAAINQWLEELAILHQQQLVYIVDVKWDEPFFSYNGISLNSGATLTRFKKEGNDRISPRKVYLYNPMNGHFISLFPFFVFDRNADLLYIYSELSEDKKLTSLLKCPYPIPGGETIYRLDIDVSKIVGVDSTSGLAQASNTLDEVSKVITPATISVNISDQNVVSSTQKDSSLVQSLDKSPVPTDVKLSIIKKSPFSETLSRIRTGINETWLTDSQKKVWIQLNKLMGPPYYVVNIYGVTGSGKTFLSWLLQKQGRAVYADEGERDWTAWRGQPLVVLDGYDSSRQAVRSLQAQLQLSNIGQVIILTRQKAQDDIPCLHLTVTDKDIQIAKGNLYRELNLIVPDGEQRNLWDCFKHLEA